MTDNIWPLGHTGVGSDEKVLSCTIHDVATATGGSSAEAVAGGGTWV